MWALVEAKESEGTCISRDRVTCGDPRDVNRRKEAELGRDAGHGVQCVLERTVGGYNLYCGLQLGCSLAVDCDLTYDGTVAGIVSGASVYLRCTVCQPDTTRRGLAPVQTQWRW